MWIIKRIIYDYFIDILFPTKCLNCRKQGQLICENCLIRIGKAERETIKDVIAVFDYQDPIIKKAIWDLKYYHKKFLGYKLGELVYKTLVEEISVLKIYSGKPIIVIPVPISKIKTGKRGYNQALLIALGFCQSAPLNTFELRKNIILKKIETIPQAKIKNRNKRLNNIKGVFEIKNNEIIKGRTIIIIDDVTTTGGTIAEIINILKKAGASKVIGFTVAH